MYRYGYEGYGYSFGTYAPLRPRSTAGGVKEGDKVKVPAFEGTVVDTNGHAACTQIRTADGYNHFVFADGDTVSVEKIADPDPDYWPPKPGEIWKAGGVEYFVVKAAPYYGESYTSIQTLNKPLTVSGEYYTDKSESSFSKSFDDFKAKRPRRVRAAAPRYS